MQVSLVSVLLREIFFRQKFDALAIRSGKSTCNIGFCVLLLQNRQHFFFLSFQDDDEFYAFTRSTFTLYVSRKVKKQKKRNIRKYIFLSKHIVHWRLDWKHSENLWIFYINRSRKYKTWITLNLIETYMYLLWSGIKKNT